MTSRRALQIVVGLFGCVALTFGLIGVATGRAMLGGGAMVPASVDSELRFYAAWYAGAGALLLSIAGRVESETAMLRGICGALVLGALGRVVSLAVAGRPHSLYLALMAIELAIPLIVLPWQAAVARRR